MISSVSNINFRGEAAGAGSQDLINSPGKFTTLVPKTEPQADTFEKKKSKAPVIIGSAAALLAAAYIGLSIAVGKGKLEKTPVVDGVERKFTDKVKDFFFSIGESGVNLWKRVRGKSSSAEA